MPKLIDVHVHLGTADYIENAGEMLDYACRYFGLENEPIPIEETVERYRALDCVAVIQAFDAETTTGYPKIPNERVAKLVADYPDVFMGLGSVDPWKPNDEVINELRRIFDLGLRGIKIAPHVQRVFPNDRRTYHIYEEIERHEGVVMSHTGFGAMGVRAPGGAGVRLKYAQPIYLDDVAGDFPGITVIGAHPSWPWQEESIAIARHKPNYYMDLSGWSPKYFSESLISACNRDLQDKALFGSDFPAIMPERWLRDFAAAPFKDEVRQRILYDNAARLLSLTPTYASARTS